MFMRLPQVCIQGGQKTESEAQKAELQAPKVGAGNQTESSRKAASDLQHQEWISMDIFINLL